MAARPTTTTWSRNARLHRLLRLAARAAEIAAEYLPGNDYLSATVAFSALVGDASFACPALQIDQETSQRVPTYAYEFNDDTAPPIFTGPLFPPPVATHESGPRRHQCVPRCAQPLAASLLRLAHLACGRRETPGRFPRSGECRWGLSCRAWSHPIGAEPPTCSRRERPAAPPQDLVVGE